MEIEVKESMSLEDGRHKGTISQVQYRTEPYQYTDIFIKEDETGYEIKYGCPTTISAKSKLGKILSQWVPLVAGEKIDPEKILLGKKVMFQTSILPGKDGNEYSRVLDGTIRKAEQ